MYRGAWTPMAPPSRYGRTETVLSIHCLPRKSHVRFFG
jgi:hypothetical protein